MSLEWIWSQRAWEANTSILDAHSIRMRKAWKEFFSKEDAEAAVNPTVHQEIGLLEPQPDVQKTGWSEEMVSIQWAQPQASHVFAVFLFSW